VDAFKVGVGKALDQREGLCTRLLEATVFQDRHAADRV
jgi:hypothetical protein